MIGETYIDVKVILEENKTNFENQLKEYLNNEYKIIASNITTYTERSMNPINNIEYVATMKGNKIIQNKIIFYALLEKE